MKWKHRGKDRTVSPRKLHAIAKEPFKRRCDLLAFASKHPGALTASFLSGLHLAMMKGQVNRTKQLREVNVAAWVNKGCGLSEVRDIREATTIAAAMDKIQQRDLEGAMDILCQRILALQAAKAKNGSWDKAEKLELIGGSGTSMGSAAMLQLAS